MTICAWCGRQVRIKGASKDVAATHTVDGLPKHLCGYCVAAGIDQAKLTVAFYAPILETTRERGECAINSIFGS